MNESPEAASTVPRPTPETTALVVVDVQEKLSATMPEQRLEDVDRALRVLLAAARELSIATFFTEQYPRGLGPTRAALRADLDALGARGFEKLTFSACGAPGLTEALPADLRSVVVVGMETHVCVFQTVRDLASRGLTVHVPADGVVSRRDDHRSIGLDLCARAGALVTTTETVVFELLERAGSPTFKAIAPLIR